MGDSKYKKRIKRTHQVDRWLNHAMVLVTLPFLIALGVHFYRQYAGKTPLSFHSPLRFWAVSMVALTFLRMVYVRCPRCGTNAQAFPRHQAPWEIARACRSCGLALGVLRLKLRSYEKDEPTHAAAIGKVVEVSGNFVVKLALIGGAVILGSFAVESEPMFWMLGLFFVVVAGFIYLSGQLFHLGTCGACGQRIRVGRHCEQCGVALSTKRHEVLR